MNKFKIIIISFPLQLYNLILINNLDNDLCQSNLQSITVVFVWLCCFLSVRKIEVERDKDKA